MYRIYSKIKVKSKSTIKRLEMEYLYNNTHQVGTSLLMFILIYFLFRIGIRLANENLGSNAIFAWIALIFGLIFGMKNLTESQPIGYLGFIPVLTYILLKIVRGIDFDYSTANKVKGVVFSGVASAVTYAITHTVFGFGIPEASISAIIAAGLLGAVGYSA